MIHSFQCCLSVSWRIDSLRNPRPFGQLCKKVSISLGNVPSCKNVLRMLFLYFFSFLSKIVYLSFGTISCSIGISSFHLSTAFIVAPCFANALSNTATTVSTALRRFRCRAFWNLDSRHGIFLHCNCGQHASWRGTIA